MLCRAGGLDFIFFNWTRMFSCEDDPRKAVGEEADD